MSLTLYITISIAVLILIITFVMIMLITNHFNNRNRNGGNSMESFYFESDKLVVNLLINPKKYVIGDIVSVDFNCSRARRSSSYMGSYVITMKDGKKSRRFLFDGSVATGKVKLYNSKEDIMKSIEKMQAVLREKGITANLR